MPASFAVYQRLPEALLQNDNSRVKIVKMLRDTLPVWTIVIEGELDPSGGTRVPPFHTRDWAIVLKYTWKQSHLISCLICSMSEAAFHRQTNEPPRQQMCAAYKTLLVRHI